MPLTGPGTNSFPGNGVIIIDETPIVGGTDGYVLYDNNGVVGVEAGGGGGSLTIGTTPISGGTANYALTVDPTGLLLDNAPVRTVLTGNATYYVNSATGSDSNPGTALLPFKTLGKAISVVEPFDYNFLYFPTINATGTFSEQNVLPALINCPNGGVINFTSATVADLGTNYTFTCDSFSQWTLGGVSGVSDFSLPGTYGGFNTLFAVNLTVNNVDFSGNYAQMGIQQGDGLGLIQLAGTNIHISSSMQFDFAFVRSALILDGSTITFPNAITIDKLFAADGLQAIVGLAGASFVNAANLTCSGQAIIFTNGAFLEASAAQGTTVDGNPATYENFPGVASGGFLIDAFSTSELDVLYREDTPTTGGTVSMAIRQRTEFLTPAGTLATLTVNLPTFAMDGDIAIISSTKAITALTVATTNVGDTVTGAPTSMAANSGFGMQFDGTTSTWMPWVIGVGGSSGLTVGSTAISGGGAGQLLYDNGGTLEETPNLIYTAPGGQGYLTVNGNGKITAFANEGNVLDIGNPTAGPGFMFFMGASNTGQFYVTQYSILGTRDIFFQALPDTTSGYGFLEAYNAAGMCIGTGGNANPLIFNINRTEVGRFTSSVLQLKSGVALKLGNAYVATPPTPTGYITLQDSTGTTYKVAVST